jgi:hypothetical protein
VRFAGGPGDQTVMASSSAMAVEKVQEEVKVQWGRYRRR